MIDDLRHLPPRDSFASIEGLIFGMSLIVMALILAELWGLW